MSSTPITPPWLLWLNAASLAEIKAAVRAELGATAAESSKLPRRITGAIRERRERGEPFESFEDFAGSRNIGKHCARLMLAVLARQGYRQNEPSCRHCPVHCPQGDTPP